MAHVNTENREITQELERLKMAVSKLSGLISSLPSELEPILTSERHKEGIAQLSSGDADSPLGKELSALATDIERCTELVRDVMERIAV